MQTANTLHIMAKTRYLPMSRDLLPNLDSKVEEVARECNSQEVANTLWAYATMGRKPGERALGALEARAMVAFVGDFSLQARRQLHQYLLSCCLDEGPRLRTGGTSQQLHEAFESACLEAFAAAATAPSESQQRVSQALRKGLGLCVQDEYQ